MVLCLETLARLVSYNKRKTQPNHVKAIKWCPVEMSGFWSCLEPLLRFHSKISYLGLFQCIRCSSTGTLRCSSLSHGFSRCRWDTGRSSLQSGPRRSPSLKFCKCHFTVPPGPNPGINHNELSWTYSTSCACGGSCSCWGDSGCSWNWKQGVKLCLEISADCYSADLFSMKNQDFLMNIGGWGCIRHSTDLRLVCLQF